jgi:undecaprenyl-diphosphatase
MLGLSTELSWIQGLHSIRTPFLDNFFIFCNFFDTVYFILILIPLVGIFVNRKLGFRIALMCALSALVNKLLKYTFDMPRPHDLDAALGILTASTPGFPSGAAQTSVLLCGILIKEWRNRWKWVFGPLYVLIICFSRIYLGLHFPRDILGGLFIGVLLFFFYLKLDKSRTEVIAMATAALTFSFQPVQGYFYYDAHIEASVPARQLAPKSFVIEAQQKRYELWDTNDHKSAYRVMQAAADYFQNDPFLVYGLNDHTEDSLFRWEFVPYRKTSNVFSRHWQQACVAYRVMFGGTIISAKQRAEQEAIYEKVLDAVRPEDRVYSENEKGNDAFCDSKVINSQLVLEGKQINVLYNYAPIGQGEHKAHFLFIPKAHRKDFRELTEEEYTEASQLSQFVIDRLKETRNIQRAYLFHKTQIDAGQTVPHWHLHLVATENPRNDLLSKISWLYRMTFGASPLPKNKLAEEIRYYRGVLTQ